MTKDHNAEDSLPIAVRLEREADFAGIRELTFEAFSQSELGHHGEAALIDRLREVCQNWLSLVAESEGKIVGHILFTPVEITGGPALKGMGLAPMSVSPEFQRRGIGTKVVQAGLDLLAERGCDYVVVLGHPAFYGRFGFEPAGRFGISSEFEGVPDEVFRIKWFDPACTFRPRGVLRYHPAFSQMTD